jgi:[lysine-biosynthesis-protein LysW]---L-2-aminoadipate ligase
MLVAIVAHHRTPTNVALAGSHPDAEVLAPDEALRRLTGGDIAIGRLDVAAALDGIESGLWELARLKAAGVRVLNGPQALVAAHDKLATARSLAAANVPHPRTAHITTPTSPVPFAPPVVVKPRFGSWGRDVVLCEDFVALRSCLSDDSRRAWFRSHGALIQELVPPRGHDLRIVVAGSMVVGAVRRVAAPGEWRTNVALGATRQQVTPPADACELAVAAARAIDADLVGVDLLPTPDGGYVVLELNGAVEFNEQYALDQSDVFQKTVAALLPAPEPASTAAFA